MASDVPAEQTLRIPAKWVLAGEHTVLHGGAAVAIPHPRVGLTARVKKAGVEQVRMSGPESSGALLQELYRDAWTLIHGHATSPAPLEVSLSGDIPQGGGLGSSAALCVLATHLADCETLDRQRFRDVATQLEHRFHGRSSGMDVAVIAENAPIHFESAHPPRRLRLAPHWQTEPFGVTFHDTGSRMRTSDAVAHVARLKTLKPAQALEADTAMREAARIGEAALTDLSLTRPEALALLRRSFELGQEAYRLWGLVPGSVPGLADRLIRQGALACKLTGAGGGGFLVALWSTSR